MQILEEQLLESNTRLVLNALAAILTFPTKFLLKNKDLYLKALKEHIGLGNQNLYINLVKCMKVENTINQTEFYAPFFREIVNNYSNFNKRLAASDIVDLLSIFSKLRINNLVIYNNILIDITKTFNSMKNQDKVDMIYAFTSIGIIQPQLFEKVTQNVLQFPFLFSLNINRLLDSFFKVGYENTLLTNSYVELCEKLHITNPRVIVSIVSYVSLLGLPSEKEFLQKYLTQFAQAEFKKFPNVLFYEFLKYVHRDTPELAKKLSDVDKNLPSKIQLSRTDNKFAIKAKNLVLFHFFFNKKHD